MSEPIAEHHEVSITVASPIHKRKRSGNQAVVEDRRPKRNVPTATMSTTSSEMPFIGNAVEVAQAAATGVNVADFSALQQATVSDHSSASDPANASSTAAAALGSIYPTLHIPPTTEEQFAATHSKPDAEHHHHQQEGPSYMADVPHPDNMMNNHAVTTSGSSQPGDPTSPYNDVRAQDASRSSHSKPSVGSQEWHQMRKDNHKEVERRRRETINEGINELSKIVPGCEKNKGSILQRAVSFIAQLKENEQQNIEKWTLEKLLTEQALNELSQSNDKLKAECARLYGELETWKHVAQNAGLEPPKPTPDDGMAGSAVAPTATSDPS